MTMQAMCDDPARRGMPCSVAQCGMCDKMNAALRAARNGESSQSDKNAALADEIDRHPVTLRLPHKCKPNSLEIETDGRALSYDENRAIIDALRASRSAEPERELAVKEAARASLEDVLILTQNQLAEARAAEPARWTAGRQRQADAEFLYAQANSGDAIFRQTAEYLADLVSKNTLVGAAPSSEVPPDWVKFSLAAGETPDGIMRRALVNIASTPLLSPNTASPQEVAKSALAAAEALAKASRSHEPANVQAATQPMMDAGVAALEFHLPGTIAPYSVVSAIYKAMRFATSAPASAKGDIKT